MYISKSVLDDQELEFESRYSQEFSLLHVIQAPIQWVQGALSTGLKRLGREADHLPPAFEAVKKMWIIRVHSLSHMPSWRSD
jgi:hypothetical protein